MKLDLSMQNVLGKSHGMGHLMTLVVIDKTCNE
jgi:hypothetical protein